MKKTAGNVSGELCARLPVSLARPSRPVRRVSLARRLPPRANAAVCYGINYKRFDCFSTVLIQFHGPVTQYCPCTSPPVYILTLCTRKLRRAQAVASRKPEPNVTVIRATERNVINSKKNNNNNRNARGTFNEIRTPDRPIPDWSVRRRRFDGVFAEYKKKKIGLKVLPVFPRGVAYG